MIKTYWNSESCQAKIVSIIVGESPHPLAWSKEFVGKRRDAVEVLYGAAEPFYLDNEDMHGWNKVTFGKGLPRYMHRSIYPEPGSVIVRKCIDPTCPCQDGDACHYEEPYPAPIPIEYAIPGKSYARILEEDRPDDIS